MHFKDRNSRIIRVTGESPACHSPWYQQTPDCPTICAFERRKMGKRHSIPIRTRDFVVLRDDYTCQYCGKKADRIYPTGYSYYRGFEYTPIAQLKGDYSQDKHYVPFEFDHVIPLHLGGTNHHRNIVLACRRCNRSKAHRSRPAGCAL